jgi:hypothetical protein
VCARSVVAVASITRVEFASVLARRVREGTLPPSGRDAIWQSFTEDLRSMIAIEINSQLLNDAVRLLGQVPSTIPLRAIDALQLAAALDALSHARGQRFMVASCVSADHRLLAAARWAGLDTDNPEDHP